MTKEKKQIVLFILILAAGICCVIYFGNKKAGFHEDEYYSYYSTNYVQGWVMPENEWTPQSRYFNEFVVLDGQEFQYGLVKTVQSWDVHPPMYYWVLHTVCSLFPGVFSKWLGLAVNMVAYVIALIFFYLIAKRLFADSGQPYLALLVTACYAFSPATVSSVMFIRMYAMLTCFLLISFYLHIRAWQEDKITHPGFLIPMAVMVYVGFLTHYYFMIYQFFLTFAICVVLLIKTKSLKKPFLYGISVIIPLILAYITYPSCLGQMFRGQRGAQATGNFFDLSNTWERLTSFGALTNEYLFQGTAGLIALVFAVALGLLFWKQCNEKKVALSITADTQFLGILIFTVLGYFVTVSKTALLLGDSSIRYVLPVFGLLLLAVVRTSMKIQERTGNKCYLSAIMVCLLCFILLGNVYSMISDNILFLYPEDSRKTAYAKEHADVPVVYVYNSANSWCIWESSDELFEYPEVYFTSDGAEDQIVDKKVQESQKLLVYINTLGDVEKQIERVMKSNTNLQNYEWINSGKFCDLYYFY